MATTITINGNSYNLPNQGASPPWGNDLSDIIQALADVSNTLLSTNDITNSTFNISNNISSATNVTGLAFQTSSVRSAFVPYSVYRVSGGTDVSEAGYLILTYKSLPTPTWQIAQYGVGSTGVTFTVTAAGQVQYTSTNGPGTGVMKFSAKTYSQ